MTNLQRMLDLVEEAFYERDDAEGQITVNEEERAHLQAISPHCLSEYDDGNGPAIWLLVIPTTHQLMHSFIGGQIDEVSLLMNTPPGVSYDALYLCSAITLPEYRHKGLTMKLAMDAIDNICKKQPIQSLFYWPFSDDGKKLAERIADYTKLPLAERTTE